MTKYVTYYDCSGWRSLVEVMNADTKLGRFSIKANRSVSDFVSPQNSRLTTRDRRARAFAVVVPLIDG